MYKNIRKQFSEPILIPILIPIIISIIIPISIIEMTTSSDIIIEKEGKEEVEVEEQ